jgi:hypothetical protein
MTFLSFKAEVQIWSVLHTLNIKVTWSRAWLDLLASALGVDLEGALAGISPGAAQHK